MALLWVVCLAQHSPLCPQAASLTGPPGCLEGSLLCQGVRAHQEQVVLVSQCRVLQEACPVAKGDLAQRV